MVFDRKEDAQAERDRHTRAEMYSRVLYNDKGQKKIEWVVKTRNRDRTV